MQQFRLEIRHLVLLAAACVFAAVKAVNALKKPLDAPPSAPELTTTEKLLTEIRDLLKDRPKSPE